MTELIVARSDEEGYMRTDGIGHLVAVEKPL